MTMETRIVKEWYGRAAWHAGTIGLAALMALVWLAFAPAAPSIASPISGHIPDEGQPLLAGTWHGVIDIPGQPLEIILHFEAADDGASSGVADIPAQGASGLALKDIEFDDDVVRFAFSDISAAVEGTFVQDGVVFEGTFAQAGMEFPFRAARQAAKSGPAPEQIDAIRSVVLRAMEHWSVPGVAVAVVQDGDVVLAEGFGLRDVEGGLPVTPTTLFNIGSSTKAFTSTAFQMLVDEGALRWDQPIRQLLPGFRLQDPIVTELITPLDFALHRSGLPRHDLLWLLKPQTDKAALVAAGEYLAPAADFRTTFLYNNFGYMLLGHLIEQTGGRSWEQFVRERILQPLGMNGTTFTMEAMRATDNYARGYATENGELTPISQPEFGAVAPAGAINSNAVDMAKWLMFQLNGGRVGHEQLVSEHGMKALQTPHLVIQGEGDEQIDFVSYGIGWFVDSYRGHYRVHHGGNTIGYSADVAFLPREGIGVAVLTNGLFTPLTGVIINAVLDTMLGLEPIDWIGRAIEREQFWAEASAAAQTDVGKRHGTSPSHDMAEYAGVYEHPAYGELTVTVVDHGLEVTYADTVLMLEHWHFDQFRGNLALFGIDIPFFFETDAAGEISRVRAGFEPMVEPIVFDRAADRRLQNEHYLRQFAGEYEYAGTMFAVTLEDNVLTLHVPGQPPYILAPMREAQFDFRDYDGFAVHFIFGEEGMVEKAILLQPQGNVELTRRR